MADLHPRIQLAELAAPGDALEFLGAQHIDHDGGFLHGAFASFRRDDDFIELCVWRDGGGVRRGFGRRGQACPRQCAERAGDGHPIREMLHRYSHFSDHTDSSIRFFTRQRFSDWQAIFRYFDILVKISIFLLAIE